jgi:hypothetical protein
MTRRSAQDLSDIPHSLRRMATTGGVLRVLFVVAGALLSACSAQYPTVVKIKLATVPPGDTVDALGEPVRENQSLRFIWSVETRLGKGQDLEWVAAALGRQGFTVRERQEHSLTLSKHDDGDSYRLDVVVTQENPTRVQVTATVAPG